MAAGPDWTVMVTGKLLPALEVAVTAKGALPYGRDAIAGKVMV
jgi:hypothetical protein